MINIESRKNEKTTGSIVRKVAVMAAILFACLVVNVILGVIIQYAQVRSNVEQVLGSNLNGSTVLATNGLKNLNILISDHSYDYQFLNGSAEENTAQAQAIASFDEQVLGVTYISADGSQYGEGVDDTIKNAVLSSGALLTTPENENGDLYYGVGNDMGALVSHMSAAKLASFLEGSPCDAFILSNDGTVIAAHTETGVYDSAYPDYVQSAGNSYINPTTIGGYANGYCYAAAYIDGSDDWTLLVRLQAGEFYGAVISSFWMNIVLVVFMSVMGAVTVLFMRKFIITPIKDIRGKIVDMSNGNISGAAVKVAVNDELGELALAVNRLAEINNEIIIDIKNTAQQIAAYNLSVHTTAEYKGDFMPIKEALESIVQSLSDVVASVEEAAREVKSSSVQMSSNSSALSDAAREESQIVDELNANLSDVYQQIKSSAEKALQAREIGEQSVRAINDGNEKMTAMLAAMEEINQTSSQIANIIKTIQDISFQTNILSLNASIEAARAGEAGKGFAVVANEVGALANNTAEAAKSTTELIETALNAVSHGTAIANETAAMLADVVEKMANSAESINRIADASAQQEMSINSVVDGVSRIANSVEYVNTSAADCASTSEVLEKESAMLYNTMERFITSGEPKENTPTPAYQPSPLPKRESAPPKVEATPKAETAAKKIEPAPIKAEPAPKKAEPAPKKAEPAPKKAEPAPKKAEPAPKKAEPAPKKAEPAPKKAEPAPKKAEPAPNKAEPAPKKAEPAPKKAEPAPKKAEPAPKKAEPAPIKAEPAPKKVEATEAKAPRSGFAAAARVSEKAKSETPGDIPPVVTRAKMAPVNYTVHMEKDKY